MNFRILSRAEIDDEKWNQCVRSSDRFRHYALTYYLDPACKEWFGLVGEDYAWVWPIPMKAFVLNRVYQPLLTQQLGPYGKWQGNIEIESVLAFLNQKYWSLNIKFNESVRQLNIKSRAHKNIELSLASPYEELRKQFNRNVLSNLKKADRDGVEIEERTEFDPWLIDRFKTERGISIRELNDEFYAQVKDIYTSFEEKGEAASYMASLAGQRIAAVMILKSKDRLLLIFSHSTQKGRKHGAMQALLNYVIRVHSNKYEILDFEGSNDENLAFFYGSFGGEEKVYLQVQNSRIPWPLNKLIK